jgi:hypothetical protein
MILASICLGVTALNGIRFLEGLLNEEIRFGRLILGLISLWCFLLLI